MRWTVRILLTLLIIPLILLIVLALLPGQWLARQLSGIATTVSGLNVSISNVSLDIFTLSPGIALEDTDVSDTNDAEIVQARNLQLSADLRAIVTDAPILDQLIVDGLSARLVVDENGRGNWQDWALPTQQTDSPEEETETEDDESPAAIPAIRDIRLSDIKIDYENAMLDHVLTASLNAEGSTSDAQNPLEVNATGTFNELPLSLDLTAQSLLAVASLQEDLEMDLNIELGDTSASIEGRVGDPSTFRELDLVFSFTGKGLDDLSEVAATTLPVLPPFKVEGSLQRDGDEFVLQRFDANIGDSDLEGDIRLNPTTEPVTLYANVISTVLDLDDLAGLAGGTPDPDEAATAEQIEQVEPSQPAAKVLPDTEIALADLATIINGTIDFRATEVRTDLFPVDSIEIQLDFQPERLLVEPLTVGLAEGVVEGSFAVDAQQTPVESTLELRLKRINLREIMASAGLENDGFGQIGGRAKYWLQGDTLASMAGSADGGMFLLMTEGKVDALLSELAGLDLVESMSLLASDSDANTDIRCAYADLHSEAGIMSVETFAIDTDDTIFLADGTVDLNQELLDLTLEPHPKDISLLAAQTAVKISGPLSNPSVLPGLALPLRAAAAAVLASVAGPAAALLPFIDSGSGEDSPYCEGLITALDDAR